MCEQAVRLTTLAIDSYADRDAVLAGALGELDDRLDELHNDYIDTVFSSVLIGTSPHNKQCS